MTHQTFNKVKKNANESAILLGFSNIQAHQSLTKADFAPYSYIAPPKPIRRKEEGIGFNSFSTIKT